MAYVYTKVAQDRNSNQTPHYGYFDGDGDFVLAAPRLFAESPENETDVDEAFVVPFVEEDIPRDALEDEISRVKSLLSSDSAGIELHDFLVQSVQRFLSSSTEDNFTTQESYSLDKLMDRISKYEEICKRLYTLEACVAYWARPMHQQILQKIISRSTDRLEAASGLAVWMSLRWYPLILQVYAAGIAAIAGKRHDSLASIFLSRIPTAEHRSKNFYLGEAVAQAILDLNRNNVFKQLPGREHNYVPMSEHLLKLLQPELDDALFLGKAYEDAFDEFEVVFSLVAADQKQRTEGHMWYPIGRFGYKGRYDENGPLARVLREARAQGTEWPPIRSGLFDGQVERFEAAAKFLSEAVAGLHWY
jgi:hypothetical protein